MDLLRSDDLRKGLTSMQEVENMCSRKEISREEIKSAFFHI